jgi:Fe2+ or Zn2+ uptake regulation protein
MEYSKPNKISEIASLLSNPIRVIILGILSDQKPRSLADIHEKINEIGLLTHRETTYNYLKKLCEGLLVDKIILKTNKTKNVQYQIISTQITFDFTK